MGVALDIVTSHSHCHPARVHKNTACFIRSSELCSPVQNIVLWSSLALTCRVRPLDWAAYPVNLLPTG